MATRNTDNRAPMERTSVYLTSIDMKFLVRQAKVDGITVSEALRNIVREARTAAAQAKK